MSNLHPSLGIVSNKSKKSRVYNRRAPKHTPPPDVQHIDVEEYLDQYEPIDIEYMINFVISEEDNLPSETQLEVVLPEEDATTETTLIKEPAKKFKHKQKKIRKTKNAPIKTQSK